MSTLRIGFGGVIKIDARERQQAMKNITTQTPAAWDDLDVSVKRLLCCLWWSRAVSRVGLSPLFLRSFVLVVAQAESGKGGGLSARC